MAGIAWQENESEFLLKLVEKEKDRAKKVGTKMNWSRVARKLNAKHKKNRTSKSCFWYYIRDRKKKKAKNNTSIPTRFPRPIKTMDNSNYEPVIKPETFIISACDNEGNIIFNLMVKNTAANVSRMLIDVAHNLNVLKDKSNEF